MIERRREQATLQGMYVEEDSSGLHDTVLSEEGN